MRLSPKGGNHLIGLQELCSLGPPKIVIYLSSLSSTRNPRSGLAQMSNSCLLTPRSSACPHSGFSVRTPECLSITFTPSNSGAARDQESLEHCLRFLHHREGSRKPEGWFQESLHALREGVAVLQMFQGRAVVPQSFLVHLLLSARGWGMGVVCGLPTAPRGQLSRYPERGKLLGHTQTPAPQEGLRPVCMQDFNNSLQMQRSPDPERESEISLKTHKHLQSSRQRASF